MSSEWEGDWTKLPGRLVVISGASGSGKSTLVKRLLARPDLRLQVSVSATTRAPRPHEQPDRDYFFLSVEQFQRIRSDLLESAQVHGHLYGTPAEPVRQAMAQGICVALVIDVQGGLQVRQKVPGALLIFVHVPSLEELENRLRARGTDDPESIERRLANARREIEISGGYDIQVVNDDLDRAVEELVSILVANGCGTRINHD
ncbi:MAG: guanylate kinase [Isosphaeraceae bacterium]